MHARMCVTHNQQIHKKTVVREILDHGSVKIDKKISSSEEELIDKLALD